eukprot:TRINITY_DN50134_c0_g1_i1.p1 TRINITY_DN50134_c0_g1~~TRINITY_DN50134_c0_g1_i1.p1  ORF type:complete len:200 (-),score=37.17 TRINITY_DN50134_c0_g1_i1:123-722(-)
MGRVFVYGTLMASEVLLPLLLRLPPQRPAILHGFARYPLKDAAFPAAFRGKGHSISGVLLEQLTSWELRVLDFYEDDGYEREEVLVSAADVRGELENVTAFVYVWPEANADQLVLDKPWSYAAFREAQLADFVENVVLPCRAEFEEQEAANQQSLMPKVMPIAWIAGAGLSCILVLCMSSHCARLGSSPTPNALDSKVL